QMLGVGLDSAVVAALDGRLKRRLGKGAYVLETVRQIFAWPFPRLDLRLDGEPSEAAQVIATKGRFYGGRLLLAPEAKADAPGFVGCLFPGRGRLAAIRAGLALPFGLLPRFGGVAFRPAKRLDILGPAGLPVQADGDEIGRTPVTVADAETTIPLVVPG
ncbi:MAG: diacylglycerol kinase family lipid kinase, partial [Elioraea sp.]|nr:diacylglycerol kinase family lipid kinase [Elioraea sp.]